MRSDPSPHVRVVAAEAFAALGGADEAAGVLGAMIDRPPGWQVQLLALNSLTFIGDAARSQLPVVQRTAASEQEYVRNAARYLNAVLTGAYQPSTPIFDIDRLMRAAKAAGGAS